MMLSLNSVLFQPNFKIFPLNSQSVPDILIPVFLLLVLFVHILPYASYRERIVLVIFVSLLRFNTEPLTQ